MGLGAVGTPARVCARGRALPGGGIRSTPVMRFGDRAREAEKYNTRAVEKVLRMARFPLDPSRGVGVG